jgi:hypothetical protein
VINPEDLPADLTRDEDPDHDHPSGTEPQPPLPVTANRVDPRPAATLYVHINRDTLDGGGCDGDTYHPVARVEQVGPVTVEQAQRWLGHCRVTVKPVLDPAGTAPVDAYQIPDRPREAVHLISPADPFPYASSTSRRLDLDHTTPYPTPDPTPCSTSTGDPTSGTESGSDSRSDRPPGQTRIANLAPMTRFHHRLKTHSRWQPPSPTPRAHLANPPQPHLPRRPHRHPPTPTRRLTQACAGSSEPTMVISTCHATERSADRGVPPAHKGHVQSQTSSLH